MNHQTMYGNAHGFRPPPFWRAQMAILRTLDVARKILDHAPALVTSPVAVRARRTMLGFLQYGIGPAVGAIDVVSRPQLLFRGERLVVPWRTARYFSIIDIKVGNRSQLANSTSMPAQAFAEMVIPIRANLDTAVVAQDIAVVVENLGKHTHTFRAALTGTIAT